MIVDNLSKEIIKRIFANIGAVPGELFGKVGLVDPSLKLDKPLVVRYDDMDRNHNMYSGKIDLGQSCLRGLFINLTVDIPEYLFIFRMDGMPIHAMKAIYFDSDDYYIRVFDVDKEVWREANMYMKARLLADFERMVSWGLMWENCSEVDDLYKVTSELVR